MVRTLWPQDQLDDWLATLGAPGRVGSLNGLSRTLYGPSVVRHLLENYPSVATCPETADAAPSDQAGRSEDNFSLCFASELPGDAVVVKTTWRRADFGLGVQSFATDADGLAGQLANPARGWTPDAELRHPDADRIFTMTNDSGGHFQLAGLHIMTKEQRDWLWITLFWSPEPDADFGEDRPEAVRALGGPWANYKMCVVTAYDEGGAVDDQMRARYPTLAASLDVALAATAPRTWCSNPYIETGAHNNVTNCIGCHQQGGSAVATETVLGGDDPRFPDFGRQKVRANFPADYLWSLGREPERLSGYVIEQMRFFDVNDQGGHR
jgi:hypothetical protein